jgi:hypothetical protein
LELDENFKRLVQELGEAINESLADSEKISEVLARIRAAGYELMLVLEVTIGYNKRNIIQAIHQKESGADSGRTELLELTPHDTKFLRALKITVEEKDS